MDKGFDLAKAYGYGGTEEEWRARASITVESTPPRSPAFGDIWVNPVTGTVEIQGGARTQSEDVVADGWRVPGDSINQIFDTREEALVRAWEITPPGIHRPEPVQASAGFVVEASQMQWVSENTLGWVGYVEPLESHSDRLAKCRPMAMTDLMRRASELGGVLNLASLKSYSAYDHKKDKYRIEFNVKVVLP